MAHAGFLGKAVAFLGADTKLAAVTTDDVTEFMSWLRRQPTPQGNKYSEQGQQILRAECQQIEMG
jgi:hypothetical protein